MSGGVSLVDGHIDEKQTNYDRIRNMSVEKMARFLTHGGFDCSLCNVKKTCDQQCMKHCKEWLESEVEE